MKKIICLLILCIALISCSNSSKIENKYWIQQEESYNPEILFFKNGIMANLTRNESLSYEIKDNFINAQKGSTTTKVEIKELTGDILRLIIDNEVITFKVAKESDLIFGSWVSNEFTIRLNGIDGTFDLKVNTLPFFDKKYSEDFVENASLLNIAIDEARKSNEAGAYSYNNNELTLNGKKYKAELSEDKKELQLDFKNQKITFKRD